MSILPLIQPPEIRDLSNSPAVNHWLRRVWEVLRLIQLNFSGLPGEAVYDPPNLAANASTDTTIAVAGAYFGDFVMVSFSLDLQDVGVTAWVSAPDVITVRFVNMTPGAVDLGSGTLRVRVLKGTLLP